MSDEIKLLRITSNPTRQLLFLGWLRESEIQKTINRYKHDYSIKSEILGRERQKNE